MNDKKMPIKDDEYIEFEPQFSNGGGNSNETMTNLEGDFEQKCNLIASSNCTSSGATAVTSTPSTNDYKHHRDQNEVEGDDEKTDEDEQNQSQLNSNTPTTQRRRRKSSGRSKLNKMLQSSSLSSSSGTIVNSASKQNGDAHAAAEDAPQSSSSTSLSSWIHLPNQQEANFNNQLSKNMTKNLNSSYDTISEEEHRARVKKRNLRSIDDDIVSSNMSSNDDLPNGDLYHQADAIAANSSADNANTVSATKTLDCGKLDKKLKQQSCDSLSSSPTNVSYDSSSPVKSSNASGSKLLLTNDKTTTTATNQNKENNHLLYNNLANGKHHPQSIYSNSINKPTSATKMTNGTATGLHQRTNQHQCINCSSHCFANHSSNYITIEQPTIPWLYESITREDSDKYLNKFLNVDGVFLVRTSSKNPDNYVLSFVHDRRVKHCHIRKLDVDSTICFSIDDGKMKFYDLKQLVEFYQLNSYFLPTKLKYFLVHSSKTSN